MTDLPRIEETQRIYRPLDRLHELYCSFSKLIVQELLLTYPNAMFTGTYIESDAINLQEGWYNKRKYRRVMGVDRARWIDFGELDLQVPSKAIARRTMLRTSSCTVLRSSSFLKAMRAWKLPATDETKNSSLPP